MMTVDDLTAAEIQAAQLIEAGDHEAGLEILLELEHLSAELAKATPIYTPSGIIEDDINF